MVWHVIYLSKYRDGFYKADIWLLYYFTALSAYITFHNIMSVQIDVGPDT